MAARKPKTEFSFDTVTAQPSTLPRVEKPNPLLKEAEASLTYDEGRMIVIPDEAVDEAENLIRRAAKTLDAGQKVRKVPLGNGTTEFHFQLTSERKTRRYTAEDVRAWAEGRYDESLLRPRVHKDVSKAYRVFMGYEAEE